MNFSQFLKQERVLLNTPPPETQEITVPVNTGIFNNRTRIQSNIQDIHFNDHLLKKGDLVKIVSKQTSKQSSKVVQRHSFYKGYFGEIVEIKKSSSTAMVRLEATNNYQRIEVPIEYLISRVE